ncbi:hypothetical protein [Nannocystis pusilla]|uniref:Lipoprotein n=1 Tax=Nannocystis pusilla TaxID=889268 RepID=A0ABS7TNB1_9BACT|nr:hypothetical protein [Nannocystis pusilla]MBZ5709714.1 hypothetical protein [Nannocystis pusilla]
MNKIVVISTFLSLALGCAGTLKLDTNSLLSRKTEDASAGPSEAAAGSSNGAGSGASDTATADPPAAAEAEAEADPGAERRAHYQPQIDRVDALLQQLPQCCQGEEFLLQRTAKYPSDPFINEYKAAYSKKFVRGGDKETPEWQAVEAKYKELEDALAAAVRLPKDVYKGKDAKKVRDTFSDYAASFTKKRVVDVVLLKEDWDRKTGSNWKGDTMVKYDNGFLRGFVVVEGDAGKGEVWEFTPRKDFLDGGKVKFDIYVPTKIADIAVPAAAK